MTRAPLFGILLGTLALSATAGERWYNPAPPQYRAAAIAGKPDKARFLASFARGYTRGRSGSVFWVGKPGVMFTEAQTPRNHGSSWDYDVHIPFVLYGPDQIRPVDMGAASAQSYDVVPTFSALMNIPAPATADGTAWVQTFEKNRPPVRTVMVVVMDQVGYASLERYADYMPNLARWRRQGANFHNVRNSWLPSVTAMAHSGIGTGTFPAKHGIPNNFMLKPDKSDIHDSFRHPDGQVNPRIQNVPTFAQYLDERFQNRSVVLSQVDAHYAAMAMAGQGKAAPGGDADVVLWYNKKTGKPTTDERYYKLPAYLANRSVLPFAQRHEKTIRAMFAAKDPSYRVNLLSDIRATPFLARWQGNNFIEMMIREGVGQDEVPDLVMVNLKSSDYAGHVFGHDHVAFPQVLAEVDRFLGAAERTLNLRAGAGNWAVAVTADHGLAPDDSKRRVMEELVADLNPSLDGDGDGKGALVNARAYMMYLDPAELAEDGKTLADVRDLMLQDPDILYAWTEDEVEAAQSRDTSAATGIRRSAYR